VTAGPVRGMRFALPVSLVVWALIVFVLVEVIG
jgi:hypothetical protein